MVGWGDSFTLTPTTLRQLRPEPRQRPVMLVLGLETQVLGLGLGLECQILGLGLAASSCNCP